MSKTRPRLNRWVGSVGVLATLSACGAGCALFDTGGWTAAGLAVADRQTLLKPISEAIPEALRLEFIILERPTRDPLLGSELWDELVEMGVIDHELRRTLNEQGIRVAIASTSPPQALQKLLGEVKEITDVSSQSGKPRRGKQLLVLPSGTHADAQTGGPVESCTIELTIDGKPVTKTFHDARAVMRVTPRSKQDGWATIEFLPEIHHGSAQMRPVPGETGWQKFETTQDVQKLFDQRFELTLNEGDAVVVTSLGDEPNRAGALFFRTESDGVPMQRMLVVRLVKTGETPLKN